MMSDLDDLQFFISIVQIDRFRWIAGASWRLRVKPNFSKRFNLILPVQSHLKKIFALPVGQIISTSPRHPVSQEGRLAIVTDVETGCGGRKLRY